MRSFSDIETPRLRLNWANGSSQLPALRGMGNKRGFSYDLLVNSRRGQWIPSRLVSLQDGVGADPTQLHTPKELRHNVAISMKKAGLDERGIADLLGKKTPSTARHYARSAALAAKNRRTAGFSKPKTRSGRVCSNFPQKQPIRAERATEVKTV
jgi:integrase